MASGIRIFSGLDPDPTGGRKYEALTSNASFRNRARLWSAPLSRRLLQIPMRTARLNQGVLTDSMAPFSTNGS
jgi:hypothetical protein